ncbi:hypothetical protein AKJ16_DCAP01985 [Drosera capensis]
MRVVECIVEGDDVEDREVVNECESAVEKEDGDRGCGSEEAGRMMALRKKKSTGAELRFHALQINLL